MIDIDKVFSVLCTAVRQGGIIAKSFQKNVTNEGKELEIVSVNETELIQIKRMAKTLVDDAVQEIILLAISQIIDPKDIILDAEEKTPLISLFSSHDTDLSLVIDPIDGTYEYIQGLDAFSICVGIIEKGQILLTIVFFPLRDIAYAIAPDGKSYIYKNFGMKGTDLSKEIKLPEKPKKIIYKNSRVPKNIIESVVAAGFKIIDDEELGCPDAILSIIEGKSVAYLSSTRQIRDIFLGAIVGNVKNGFISDWSGNTIQWPKSGRLPEAIFGNIKLKSEINDAMIKNF